MKNIVFVLLVLCVCGFGGVSYFPKFIDARIHEQINNAATGFQKQNAHLAELVKNLEFRLQKLENSPSQYNVSSNFNIDFDRWTCWCDLKNKLLRGDECSGELEKFRKVFSDRPDLLKMMDSVIANENNTEKDNSLINNLLRFAKIRGINGNELDKITGYVLLLSIRKAGSNE
ncbi:MAG: hypothetical protein J6S86_03375 [Alphaproteobacteria bacterium]|nr:hypothetical protein [Alphaproteobacteria bacterium]